MTEAIYPLFGYYEWLRERQVLLLYFIIFVGKILPDQVCQNLKKCPNTDIIICVNLNWI